jgi:hypothetical protein
MTARPFPLPADLAAKELRPSTPIVRAACAHLRAFIDRSTPEAVAKRMFGRDEVTLEILRKAASTPATTTTTGWAAELATISVFDLVQRATTVSAAAELIARGLQLDMTGVAQIRVPGRSLSGTAVSWIAEGVPAPARQLAFSTPCTLIARKMRLLTSFTEEQIRSSNIEAIVEAALAEEAALGLDLKMFSSDAATSAAPGGLFTGPGLTATAGGGVAAMVADIRQFIGALAANNAGRSPIFVAAAQQAATMKTSLGPLFDYPILTSTVLAPGIVGVIETGSFVSSFSSVPEFKTSRDASIHFESTTPADPIMSGQPVKSLFQVDATALAMTIWVAFGMRNANHTAWLSGATW